MYVVSALLSSCTCIAAAAAAAATTTTTDSHLSFSPLCLSQIGSRRNLRIAVRDGSTENLSKYTAGKARRGCDRSSYCCMYGRFDDRGSSSRGSIGEELDG